MLYSNAHPDKPDCTGSELTGSELGPGYSDCSVSLLIVTLTSLMQMRWLECSEHQRACPSKP